VIHKRILIVGQGIAGTCAAWEAEKIGVDFTIVDEGSSTSASAVSSGIMNPITGRNFVKSWMSDDFMRVGTETYKAMSLKYNQTLIHETPMMRHIASIESENVWHSKAIQEGYTSHMQSGPSVANYKSLLNDIHSLGTVTSSKRVDVADLLRLNRDSWKEERKIIEENFEEDKLEIGKDQVRFQSEAYDSLILAKGWKGGDGTLFKTDVYRPAKGEVLLVRIPNMPTDYIIKYNKFIVPQGGDLFWIGTTWQWEFDNAASEEHKSKELEEFLNDFLNLKYEIIERKAGVRPATKYRRPLIGSHKQYPHIFLFNGLGTKGVTMAPYWARQIIDHISGPNFGQAISFTEAYGHAFKKK